MAKRKQLPRKPESMPGKVAGRGSSQQPLLLLIVAVAVVVVVAGIVVLQGQAVSRPVEISGLVAEGRRWGPEDALVKIVNYSDFGCIHCRDFALNQGKQLRSEYEAGGKVSFEFKYFIIGGTVTANAANAAQCAAEQGRFWDYHDVLFSQQGVSQDPFNKAALKQYAAQIGLDTREFNRCVDDDRYLEDVYRDTADGRSLDVSATPTFFINGEKISGAIPYDALKARVDVALGGS